MGEYSLSLLKRFPKAEGHLFEPSSECLKKLHSLFAEQPQILVNDCALSDAVGEAMLWFDHPGSALASLYKRDLKEYSLELNESQAVRTTTLESYIETKKVGHVNNGGEIRQQAIQALYDLAILHGDIEELLKDRWLS